MIVQELQKRGEKEAHTNKYPIVLLFVVNSVESGGAF